MVKRVGKFTIGRTLGEGTFGKVKHAVNEETGERVAIKILEKDKIIRHGMTAQIKNEISVMKLVKHPHIINLKDVLASKTKIYIVLELVTGGELFYRLANEGRFTEAVARNYFVQLLRGVVYCHRQGVCHRDLKPENLLLDADDLLKISDFGLSSLTHSDGGRLLHTTCGTPNYVAPEVLSSRGYDGKAADVWSCGVILYVFLAGYLPFEDPNTEALFRKIQRAQYSFPGWISDSARDLLRAVLQVDPSQRLTTAQIMKHPWIKEGGVVESVPGTAEGPGDSQVVPVVPVEGDSVIAEVEENDDEGGPRPKLNAFDLISMSGALNLARMLQPQDEWTSHNHTTVSSSIAPADLLAKLREVLEGMNVGFKVVDKEYRIQVTAVTRKGVLTFSVHLWDMGGGRTLVEFLRGKGDILDYHANYRAICGALGDVVELVEKRR